MSNSEEIFFKKKLSFDDSACHAGPLKELAGDILCDKGCMGAFKKFKSTPSKDLDAHKGFLNFDQDPIIPHFKKIEQ